MEYVSKEKVEEYFRLETEIRELKRKRDALSKSFGKTAEAILLDVLEHSTDIEKGVTYYFDSMSVDEVHFVAQRYAGRDWYNQDTYDEYYTEFPPELLHDKDAHLAYIKTLEDEKNKKLEEELRLEKQREVLAEAEQRKKCLALKARFEGEDGEDERT